jgi:hypothetical protein
MRTLAYAKVKENTALQEEYSTPLSASASSKLLNNISPTAVDSLSSYGLLPSIPDPVDISNFLVPVYTSYIQSVRLADLFLTFFITFVSWWRIY